MHGMVSTLITLHPPSTAGCSADFCITTEYSKKACTACVFPFTYDGITHSQCTYYGGYSKPWCGTKTDENGVYQSGNWGYCNMDKCTAPELIQEIELKHSIAIASALKPSS